MYGFGNDYERLCHGMSINKYFNKIIISFYIFIRLVIVKYIYRVIQEEFALLWEMIVWVILSKKVHTNMGPILNGYGVMGIF